MQQILRHAPIVLVTAFLLLWTAEILTRQDTGVTVPWSELAGSGGSIPSPQDWDFNPVRDADDFTLREEQCSTAFPELYHEIDRSVAFWGNRGGVQRADTDIGFAELGAARLRISRKQVGLNVSPKLAHQLRRF